MCAGGRAHACLYMCVRLFLACEDCGGRFDESFLVFCLFDCLVVFFVCLFFGCFCLFVCLFVVVVVVVVVVLGGDQLARTICILFKAEDQQTVVQHVETTVDG